ncbi:cyanobacterial phytochrome A, partial [Singulisphaera rosea]
MAEVELARRLGDTTECDREPIHIPGAIQPHGALLALRAEDLTILRASANVPDLLGLDLEDLLGRPLADFVGPGPIEHILDALRGDVEGNNPIELDVLAVPGETFDAILHPGDDAILLELEPRSRAEEDRSRAPS